MAMLMRALRAAIVAVIAALAGCVPPPTVKPPAGAPHPIFTPTSYDRVPGWSADTQMDAWPAFLVGCKALRERELVSATRAQPIWQVPCSAAETIDAHDAIAIRRFFEDNFTPYRIASSDGAERGLVTGYYEPLLHGSRTRSDRYPTPFSRRRTIF
jgi:membrane-bound lytic murein transglycosylase A